MKRSRQGPSGKCRCAYCGYTGEHKTGEPCDEKKCPQCGHLMDREEAIVPRQKAWFQGFAVTRKGGPGSGNHGHAGRPGQRGGSAPKAGIANGVYGNQADSRKYAEDGDHFLGPAMESMHEKKGQFDVSHFVATGNAAKIWRTDKDYTDFVFVRYTGSQRWSVEEGKGKAPGTLSVIGTTSLNYTDMNHTASFESEAQAKRFLNDRYGIDWDGKLRPEDPPHTGRPGDAMRALQQCQADRWAGRN